MNFSKAKLVHGRFLAVALEAGRRMRNFSTSATGIRKKRLSCAMMSIPMRLCPMEKSSST
jgi:hypothetical protein